MRKFSRLTRPRASHASAAETENDLLPSSPPRINKGLVIHIVANGHRRSDGTLCITVILSLRPSIRYCEGNDHVRICVVLTGSGAGLPIANISNKTRIFSVIDVVVEAGGRGGWRWRGRRWRRGRWRWPAGAGPVLTTSTTIIRVGSTPLRHQHTSKAKMSIYECVYHCSLTGERTYTILRAAMT